MKNDIEKNRDGASARRRSGGRNMKNNMTKNTDTSRISKPDDDNAMQDNTVKNNVKNVKNINQTKIFKKTGGEEFPDDGADLHAAVHRPEGCEDERFHIRRNSPRSPVCDGKIPPKKIQISRIFPLISCLPSFCVLLGAFFSGFS